jgi:hypothetical protein
MFGITASLLLAQLTSLLISNGLILSVIPTMIYRSTNIWLVQAVSLGPSIIKDHKVLMSYHCVAGI